VETDSTRIGIESVDIIVRTAMSNVKEISLNAGT
jgi:hypothetical protein